ncbi:phospholipase D family protein [Cryobacterium sp. Sr3]|uniref:phospholipase D family protein n=1 Tax=Cryobacterium sp. Sr3 TaxID=1259194 RepID=UPI00106A2C32|nr:phospholipase D family protein [Cryobacterium sp. Sr3]TFB59646.1 hypothetical protein E3N94_03335 [Cryobacterium sp. Sr3]
MKARFVGQPAQGQPSLLDFVEHVLTTDADHLVVVVAWAKRSGLGRVADQLATFRAGGGHVEMIVGVSEGGATKEGLTLARELSDKAFVFHDPRRTFHPKVYLATGGLQHSLFVGSSNLTAGGLGWNYESSLWLDSSGAVEGPFAEAIDWIATLRSEPTVCRPLTEQLVDEMMSSRDIFIASEDAGRRVSRPKDPVPEDSDSVVSGSARGLFGNPVALMRTLPALAAAFKKATSPGQSKGTAQAAAAPATPQTPPTAASAAAPKIPQAQVVRRWFKDMDSTAAQKPKTANSNPTGNLRLSKEGFPFDHQTYFISDFFAGLPWSPRSGNANESEVIVAFDTYVDGISYGELDIRISHDPHRAAGQGNVPTVLHWGPVMSKVLRAGNFVGSYVSLEKVHPEGFRLVIAAQPAGDFAV